MLERLDTVDWARLTHAYGSATDVPDQIRALRSADADVREKALGELYGNIFHQGTRYEASAHAVPFLLELLADPATPDREEIVGLLVRLAIGYDEAHLPSGYDIAEHRSAAVGGEALLEAGRAYTDEDDGEDDEGDEEDEPDDDWLEEPAFYSYLETLDGDDANRLHAYVELAVYDAVRAGLPLIRTLLADGDAGLRRIAAYALGWFPEEASESLPALGAAAKETDAAVAATALVSTSLLATPESAQTVRLLEDALDDARELVRWGAAVALAQLRGPAAGPRAAEELRGWLGRDTRPRENIPFYGGDLRGCAAQSLRLLGDTYADGSFAELLARLPEVSGTEALPMADAALRLAFPDGPLAEGTPFAALDERKQGLIRVLADSPGTWRLGELRLGNFSLLVAAYGLPGDPEAMAAYSAGRS